MIQSSSLLRMIPLLAAILVVLLAPFFFPWPYVLVLAVVVGYFFPPITLVVGALLDTLYFGGKGIPYFTLLGAAAMLILFFVQQFVKARIMS